MVGVGWIHIAIIVNNSDILNFIYLANNEDPDILSFYQTQTGTIYETPVLRIIEMFRVDD